MAMQLASASKYDYQIKIKNHISENHNWIRVYRA